MGNGIVKGEKPGGRGVNGSVLREVKRPGNGEFASYNETGEEGVDMVCVWLVGNGFEKDVKIPEPAVHPEVERDGISGLVNIITLNRVDDTVIEHIEDRECGGFGRMLTKY